MIVLKDDSSSSHDANIIEALRETTDQEFSQNSVFNNDRSEAKLHGTDISPTEANVKSSLRSNLERIGNCETFGVSKSYKEFVTKKLYKLLNRNIELTQLMNTKPIKRKNRLKGIKLLLSSSDTLTCHDEVIPNGRLSDNRNTVHEDPKVNMLRCQEVAVEPEFIIAKTETALWNERQRGTVFKYKKTSNGTLIEQTDS